jgi:GT2 family glycosyltransferase
MLSVITITFNNFSDLLLTVNSIPKLQGIESVIINGGNCLQTAEFLKHYAGTCVSEKDKGISDAFNKGFERASGEYVTFLNSGDVLIGPSYYKEAQEILSSRLDIDFVYADISFLDQFAGEIHNKSIRKLPYMPYLHPTLILRRSVMQKIGNFDLDFKIAMDLDFAYRLVNSGSQGYYLQSAVVKMDGLGVSSTNYFRHYTEVLRVIVKNRDFSFQSAYYLLKHLITLSVKVFLIKIGGKSFIGWYRKKRYGS